MRLKMRRAKLRNLLPTTKWMAKVTGRNKKRKIIEPKLIIELAAPVSGKGHSCSPISK
jgi:hypothetical protein